MESKKINQLATELTPDLSDLTIIGDPTTGVSKKITLSQMASLFTGTVEEYANFAAFPLVGVADTIYIAKDTNVIYRWDSTAYVVLSPNIIASLVFNDANGFDGNISLVGSVATLTITTALTTGSVPFIGASGALTQDNANLFFDDTNNRLGINTNAPTTALDVFGSGIIGRINGTSTNNAYLGFASAGTNKWSVGNVQSDHRFRIFSEANSAELVSVLQTGEFGIGIANPLTKLHIDGGATALIANLDANVSVAKTLSFRSDNSNRINLEVSGTESGSNAGANFFIRRYSDAGALIDTPLTITRSTGAISLATALSGTSATFSSTITAAALSRIGDVFIGGRSGTYASYPDGIFGDNLHLGATGTGGSVYINAALNRSLIINPIGGNVGINTNTPIAKFSLALPDGITSFPTYSTSDQASIGWNYWAQSSDLFTRYLDIVAKGAPDGTNGGSVIRFLTNPITNASNPSERLRITRDGNIAIRTTNPASLFSLGGIFVSPTNFPLNYTPSEFRQSFFNTYYANGEGAFPQYLDIACYGQPDGTNGGGIIRFLTNPVTSGSATLERMRIRNDGNVSINSTVTGGKLYVVGDAGAYTCNLQGIGTTGQSYGLIVSAGSTSGDYSLYVRNAAQGSPYIYIRGDGYLYSASAWSGSDRRLKENIVDLDNGLNKVLGLKARKFDFIDGFKNQYGFIAQELQEIIPDAVSVFDEEKQMLAVKMDFIIPHLVKAIQEQQSQIEELKAKIK
jgi:hypothetical protein